MNKMKAVRVKSVKMKATGLVKMIVIAMLTRMPLKKEKCMLPLV